MRYLILACLLSGCATQRDFNKEVLVRREFNSYIMQQVDLVEDRVIDLEKGKIGFEPDGEGAPLGDIKR